MARKASANSDSTRGFGDIIGVVLLAVAMLLIVAQLSFDRNDLPFNKQPPNHPAHNWIGPLGAHMAHKSFLVMGFSAYMLPFVLALVGVGCWFENLSFLKRRWPWAVLLLLSCMGWMHLLDGGAFFAKARESIGATSVGGLIGHALWENFFWMLGSAGAAIVYAALEFISLLFLTNFQLGEWLRRLWTRCKGGAVPPPEEEELERRAKDLQKQAKTLQDEVERSGLGADLKPVPEPTVRDLSVPQAKPGRARKSAAADAATEPEPADEGEVIPAKEVAAATTADILGKRAEPATKSAEPAGTEAKADASRPRQARREDGCPGRTANPH